MKIAGIDPGLEGAVSVLDEDGNLVTAADLPHVDKVLQPLQLKDLLTVTLGLTSEDLVVIEQVAAFPQNGSLGNFKLGFSYGVIKGVVGSIPIPMETTRPTIWKKRMGFIGQEKDATRRRALEMWPSTQELFNFKKNVGRSDAAMIALDYYRQHRV